MTFDQLQKEYSDNKYSIIISGNFAYVVLSATYKRLTKNKKESYLKSNAIKKIKIAY